jgi:predicted RNase H-like nuclease (RuvC/YqgF family)
LFPLRNLELEFHQLNDQITLLEERYSMLIAERDRAEREQRVKSDLDRNAIIEMRAEIDVLRGQLQRIAL